MSRQYPIPDKCPVCGNQYAVTQLRCKGCGTKMEGNFTAGKLANLSDKQLAFVETFLANRGNIQKVGKALGISYPTVRNRLDDVLATMGIDSKEQDILAMVKSGEISVEEAAKMISGLKKEV